jgi:hypothetical protein
MIQDQFTLTMIPDGSIAFYMFLAASFSFLFLRWFAEFEMDQQHTWVPRVRFGALVSVFAVLIVVLWGGVPGAAPHFQYRSLDHVCDHMKPFLHGAARELPATFGNCNDEASHPPQPCVGHENLQTDGDSKEYMNAIWMGGLRSMRINSCKLSKTVGGIPGDSLYRFNIAGKFDELTMFLRVRKCMPVGGCVHMNSADHCCGSDIRFNFTFGLDCHEGSMNAIRSLKLIDAKLGQMIVEQDFASGMVNIQAMDISGEVEHSVVSHIHQVMQAKVKWGAQKIGMADLINKIVQYNAPGDVGHCL